MLEIKKKNVCPTFKNDQNSLLLFYLYYFYIIINISILELHIFYYNIII